MKIHTSHAEAAEEFVKDGERTQWHDETLWHVREKRDLAAHKLPEREILRDNASLIKESVLSYLDEQLIQFEKNALDNGVAVLWAKDAQEHNAHVLRFLQEHNIQNIVKSISILTEECG